MAYTFKNVDYSTLHRPRKLVSRWACEFTQEDWERCWAYEREGYDHEIAVIKVHDENWQMKCFTWKAEKLERMGEYEEAMKLRIMGGEEPIPPYECKHVLGDVCPDCAPKSDDDDELPFDDISLNAQYGDAVTI